MFFGPAFAVNTLIACIASSRRLPTNSPNVNARLERAKLSFASALVAALDARRPLYSGSLSAVAVYARDIAARLQLSKEQQQLAHLCGLVHDIGKVGLPPDLEKPGALTLEERRMMEEHSVIGERILANVEDYAEIAKIGGSSRTEDGNGYRDAFRAMRSRSLADHRCSGRVQRDDVGPAVPVHADPRRTLPAGAGRVDAVRYHHRCRVRGDSGWLEESYLSGLSADFGVEVQRQPCDCGHWP